MKRWEVTIRVGNERIKHVVRAHDEAGATAKGLRSHEGATVVDIKQLGDAA